MTWSGGENAYEDIENDVFGSTHVVWMRVARPVTYSVCMARIGKCVYLLSNGYTLHVWDGWGEAFIHMAYEYVALSTITLLRIQHSFPPVKWSTCFTWIWNVWRSPRYPWFAYNYNAINVSLTACVLHYDPWIHTVEPAADSRAAAAVFEKKTPYVEGKSLQSFLCTLTVDGSIFVLKIFFYLLLRV